MGSTLVGRKSKRQIFQFNKNNRNNTNSTNNITPHGWMMAYGIASECGELCYYMTNDIYLIPSVMSATA